MVCSKYVPSTILYQYLPSILKQYFNNTNKDSSQKVFSIFAYLYKYYTRYKYDFQCLDSWPYYAKSLIQDA